MKKAICAGTIVMLMAASSLPLLAKGHEVRLEARLVAPLFAGDISGKVEFRNRIREGRRQFTVEMEGMSPGAKFDVMVAGQVVGTVEVDGFGIGELHYDDNFEPKLDDPATQFPPNFPNLDGGEHVVVGPLSGNLQPR